MRIVRLEIQKVKIDGIAFGNETNVSGSQLTINKDSPYSTIKRIT